MTRAILILIIALVGALNGQESPVSWSVKAPESVTANQPFTVEVTVTIEAPYHIYGLDPQETGQSTEFSAAPKDDRVSVKDEAEPSRPAKLHEDEYGKYTYWENEITFEVPLIVGGPEAAEKLTFDLVMDYMACTNEGCLPPANLTKRITVAVAEGEATPPSPTVDPGSAFGGVSLEDPAEAQYPVTITSAAVGEIGSDGRTEATLTVAIGGDYHIYGFDHPDAPTGFRIAGTKRVTVVGDPQADREPELHVDTFDTYSYWEKGVTFTVPIRVDEAQAGEKIAFKLEIEHTACNDQGCLAPEPVGADLTIEIAAEVELPRATIDGDAVPGREVDLLIPVGPEVGTVDDTIPQGSIRFSSDDLTSVGDGVIVAAGSGLAVRVPVLIKDQLSDGAEIQLKGVVDVESGKTVFAVLGSVSQPITAFILLAAAAALLALLTPCVFPMIPITVSFFTKQAETAHYPPVTMGLVYSFGIVASFTAIGVIFTLALGPSGAIEFAQSPVTLAAIAILFIVFALSLFGMFELQLPASVMNLVGRAQGKGGLIGVLLLGLLFAVTSFTCTAPFVGTILAGAAASGAWTRPIVGMVVFSGVLAIPFFFLSIFPSRLKSMPRAGGWLNEVKVVMGFIEVAAAFKFLGDMDPTVFTRFLVLCVWTITFGACGLYLLGLFRLPHDTPKEKVGVLGMVFALFFLCFALYCTKGLDGEPIHKDIDAYLPAEVKDRTPHGKRMALAKEIASLGGVAVSDRGGASNGGALGRLGYDDAFHYWDKDKGKAVDDDPYEDAIAEAKRLGTALFIDFTGYA